MNPEAYFLSDIHLKSMEERNSQTLLRFFHSLAKNPPSHLFLVGDIFDLWIGKHRYFIDHYRPLIETLKVLVTAGSSASGGDSQTSESRATQVHFFEGNHDLYLKQFWQDELGIQVHADAEMFDLFGKRVRVEHGDLINPDDKGYLFLRGLLRSMPLVWLEKNLPDGLITKIGERASHASREYTSTRKGLPEERIRELIRAHALKMYASQAFDLIITGHVHVQDDIVLNSGSHSFRSINLGSWFDEPKVLKMSQDGALFKVLTSL